MEELKECSLSRRRRPRSRRMRPSEHAKEGNRKSERCRKATVGSQCIVFSELPVSQSPKVSENQTPKRQCGRETSSHHHDGDGCRTPSKAVRSLFSIAADFKDACVCLRAGDRALRPENDPADVVADENGWSRRETTQRSDGTGWRSGVGRALGRWRRPLSDG